MCAIRGNLVIEAECHKTLPGVCGGSCPWLSTFEGQVCTLFGGLEASEDAFKAGEFAFQRHEKCLIALKSMAERKQTKRWRNEG